jgi:hypothetical protein
MSDQSRPYYETDRRGAIYNFVLSEMVRGALYGLVVLGGIVLVLYAIWGLGLLLPEDSKNAPPPMPFSEVQILAPTASA